MRKKLNSQSGLTVVELLAATVVLMLLGLMLNTGLQTALSTYRAIVAQSELELLLSTAVDALADDLRYARDVSVEDTSFTYTSDSFGEGTKLTVDLADGQIKAEVGGEKKRVLSTGAYGLNEAYKVKDDMEISYDGVSCFTIKLTVATKDDSLSAKTPDEGVVVRCLNAKKESP